MKLLLLLLLSLVVSGCELVANIFQAGLLVGVVIVVLIVAVIAWIVKRFRG